MNLLLDRDHLVSLVKELTSSRTCTLNVNIDSTSFHGVDGIHDSILLTPDSESGNLQLRSKGGLDDMAALSCATSSDIANTDWGCTCGKFNWDPGG